MSRLNQLLLPAALALACFPAAALAQGNFPTTFVSNTGDDGNPCTSVSPCRTFGRAQLQVADGGHILCLDTGAFAVFEAVKSITVDCTGTLGYITGASLDGIRIDTPGVDVVIRGLTIRSAAGGTPGLRGIRFLRGNSLTVENVTISGFPFTNSTTGFGITFSPNSAARLTVINSTIADNGTGTSGGGILVQPSGAGYATVTLEDVRLANFGTGLFLDTSGSSGASSNVTATRTLFSSGNNGVSVFATTIGATVNLVASTVSGNNSAGLRANGANARIVASASTISGNSTGIVSVNGGIVGTLGNNNLFGNGVNGTFNGFLTQN